MGCGRCAAVLVALVAVGGCVDGLGMLSDQGLGLDDVPGMGSVDLSEAQLRLDLDSCQRTQLLLDGDRQALAAAIPEPFALEAGPEEEPLLIVTLTRCQTVTADNRTFEDPAMLTVGTPIVGTGGSAVRDDAILATGATNETLAALLGAHGLPVEPIHAVREDRSQDYGMAEQRSLSVVSLGYDLEAQLTTVSVETDIPYGAGPAIGSTGWAVDGNRTLELRRGLDVTELGGVSATVEMPAGGELASLAANRTASAHGFEVQLDARAGLVPAETLPEHG